MEGKKNQGKDEEYALRERLKALIYDLEPSLATFCDKAGISPNTMKKKFSDHREVGTALLLKINATYPFVNLHWLVTGVGNKFLNQNGLVEEDKVDYKTENQRLKDELIKTQSKLIKHITG